MYACVYREACRLGKREEREGKKCEKGQGKWKEKKVGRKRERERGEWRRVR